MKRTLTIDDWKFMVNVKNGCPYFIYISFLKSFLCFCKYEYFVWPVKTFQGHTCHHILWYKMFLFFYLQCHNRFEKPALFLKYLWRSNALCVLVHSENLLQVWHFCTIMSKVPPKSKSSDDCHKNSSLSLVFIIKEPSFTF